MGATTPLDELFAVGPRLLDEIQTAMATGDRRTVERDARALRGHAHAAGEHPFGHLCEALECAARDADSAAAAAARRVLPFAWTSLRDRHRSRRPV